uniref:Sulfite exporter TauE/SafE family protein n=1 Tax=Schlesneria paludicola TaxID=360056 RepID=A0A7C2P0B0_9PLAN
MTAPWCLIALGGLLGSSHCLGMCGGFAVLLGIHRASWRQNLFAQLAFSLGRLTSYATLGVMAGFAGRSLSRHVPTIINVPAVLSLLAGSFLLWEGLHATGLLRRRVAPAGEAVCLFGPMFSTLLKHPALRGAFSAGVFTGLLPCGLVYAFVSLAASSGDLLRGAAIMLAFGAGTVPLMLLAGAGVLLLAATTRQRLWQAAAWSVVATGLLTVGRGISFLHGAETAPAHRCPLCAPAETRLPATGLFSFR